MSAESPHWASLLKSESSWKWRTGKLWHKCALNAEPGRRANSLQYAFVKLVYADQNSSRVVRKELKSLIDKIGEGEFGLNIGSGNTEYPKMINLEISDGPNVDIVGYGSELPFKDNVISLVIMQEVLEHVEDFQGLVSEIKRVLKPGGICYCQVPFQIGFHPGPADYWRFSKQGLEAVFADKDWRIERIEISLGHGSGFYRIAVEFFAVTASCLLRIAYKPVKLLAAIALYPLKFFDLLTNLSNEKDRIPAGYYCVVSKIDDVP